MSPNLTTTPGKTMSNYGHTLSLTIPPDLLLVGKSIARALDPDVGGYESFGPVLDGETIVAYTTSTPCTAGFYEQALYMLANPEVLHRAVSDDYFVRWGELVPPTLDECVAFCAAVVLPVEPEPNPQP